MFALMQSTRTQSLHLFTDPPTGLKAVVAIHSEQLGPAMGGCRYLPYACLLYTSPSPRDS